MAKKGNFLNNFNLRYFLHPVRLLVLLVVLFYIMQIGPKLNLNLGRLFDNTLVRLAVIALLFSLSHIDGPLSLLLLLALLVTFVPGFVTGVTTGAQKAVEGTAEGAKTLVTGAAESAGTMVTGLTQGPQQAVGGVAEGTQQLLSSVGRGFQEVLQGASGAVGDVVAGATTENMANLSSGACQAMPRMVNGCDPVVGSNASYVKHDKSDKCLFGGVKVWDGEQGPQGLNQGQPVMGYSGDQLGASY